MFVIFLLAIPLISCQNVSEDYSWDEVGNFGWQAFEDYALRWKNRSQSELDFDLYIIDHTFEESPTFNIRWLKNIVCGALHDKLQTGARLKLDTVGISQTVEFDYLNCELMTFQMLHDIPSFQLFGSKVQKLSINVKKIVKYEPGKGNIDKK